MEPTLAPAPTLPERGGLCFGKVLAVILLLVGGGVLFGLAGSFRRASADGGLDVPSSALDFGEVWEDPNFTWMLPITNSRTHEVEITKFRATCTCSRIEPQSLLIPAGQTREVCLRLDLSPRKREELGVAIRDFAVSIAPELAGTGPATSWTIRGRVRSTIQCDPPLVDLGSESELAQPLASRRVAIHSFVSLRGLTATCDPPLFAVQVKKPAGHVSDRFDLLITPKGLLPRGEIRCTIILVPELTDGQRLLAKKVKVEGTVVGDVAAIPSTILLGGCHVGNTAEEKITLHSLTDKPFVVLDVRSEGAGLTVERLPGAPSDSRPTFLIKQVIAAAGERSGKILVRVRPDQRESCELVVRLSYCGIKAGTK